MIAPSTELRYPGLATLPIQQQKYFQAEREKFGYRPSVPPEPLAFDSFNRPYFRKGSSLYRGRDGGWEVLDLSPALRTHYVSQGVAWNDAQVLDATHQERRLTYDNADRLWAIVETRWNGGSTRRRALAMSSDFGSSWLFADVTADFIWLETRDGWNDLSNPPSLLAYVGGGNIAGTLKLYLPSVSNDAISLGTAITIAADALQGPPHSGGGNQSLSYGDKVFVVWARAALDTPAGVLQAVRKYDRASLTLGSVVTLGSDGYATTIDNHNLPAITIDGDGKLHAVLGAHHGDCLYTASTAALDVSSWTTPVAVGNPAVPVSGGQNGHTYFSLICDRRNDIHIASRWSGNSYYFDLVSISRRDGVWAQQQLVHPFRNNYAIWYHHLALDRRGRLFLSYQHYHGVMDGDSIAAFEARYGVELTDTYSDKPHDPCWLVNEEGAWRLATSADVVGYTPRPTELSTRAGACEQGGAISVLAVWDAEASNGKFGNTARDEYDAEVLSDSPWLFVKLEDSSGNAIDAVSGSSYPANNATRRLPGPLVGSDSYSFGFNGVSTNVNLGHASYNPWPTYTVELWAKFPVAPPPTEQELVTKYAGGATQYPFLFRLLADGRLLFAKWGGSSGVGAGSATSVCNGAWRHVAGVHDGVTIRLYVDGVMMGSMTDTIGAIPPNAIPIIIGSRGNNLVYFKGAIGRVAIYDIALSRDRVFSHYAAGRRVLDAALKGASRLDRGFRAGKMLRSFLPGAYAGTSSGYDLSGGAFWAIARVDHYASLMPILSQAGGADLLQVDANGELQSTIGGNLFSCAASLATVRVVGVQYASGQLTYYVDGTSSGGASCTPQSSSGAFQLLRSADGSRYATAAIQAAVGIGVLTSQQWLELAAALSTAPIAAEE